MTINHIPLGVFGISHRTAPVEIRDLVALNEQEQKTAITSILKSFGVEGVMIISTCNRTEVFISKEDPKSVIPPIRKWFNDFKKSSYFLDDHLIYEIYGIEAARHYFRVINGMDSLIVGETQIAGQVRDGYELAHELEGTDSLLNKLFNFAMQAKKRVRNETFLCDGTVSISFAGVELARKIFSDLREKEILVIGAGKTADLAAFHFMENEMKNIHVVNRTYQKARDLADMYHGQAYELKDLPVALKNADVVISATSSETFVVTPGMMENIAKARNHRPIFLIDLAIPRDIDPRIQEIDGVFLYNLDDLNEIVEMNLKKREKELPKSQKIVDEYLLEFQKWYANNSMASIAGRLKKQLDTLRMNEIARLKNHFSNEGLNDINLLTESIINKVVRQHMKTLKKNSGDPERYQQHVDLIYSLFELEKD
ncbi:MAG: glutamyl-tRNA reductase [Cyclobacteriaceae bacterium]|nr:glutamyl-tRNA reductase [Cyclobacteriaceae bacterium]